MAYDVASFNRDKKVSLTVREAYALGRHRGIARLHRDLLSALGLANGDIIELGGGRRTYAKVHELYPTDQEKDIIRLDEILRTNVAVGIGGKVSVTPAGKEIPQAESVIMAPLAEALSFVSEDLLAQQLDSIPVTAGDLLVTHSFREMVVFRVVEVRLCTDKPSNAGAAIITKDTKLAVRPKPVARYQQTLKYEAGLRGLRAPGMTNKGPIDLTIVARGIVDESIENDYQESEVVSKGVPKSTDRSTSEQGVVLTLELTLSASRFVNEMRTFRRLVPPNERARAIIDRCMDSAIKVVNGANAKLSPSTAEFTPTTPAHEMFRLNKENSAKLSLLHESVFGAAEKILNKWSAIAAGVKDEEGETGGGDLFIG
ncbi:Cell division protein 48 (CDC48), N-terminal domain [Candidatus Nitrososphaera evergladensis SR1]|uniref:Cell division protein 48 (CDC48), N-terminal domain n=1 Tax=Candidatus Nitrososphaera evergladensis SR1 TaxID=1459636 RepID=A0A075MX81_9ARCH|nr:hypothetical protein [Candidatus Nitrososphaera evergladensis]AIF83909.1 Cell division protein 48 (CDC48), N-terminal domain [Candidatus Nitrososphaera evergladensis SR1]